MRNHLVAVRIAGLTALVALVGLVACEGLIEPDTQAVVVSMSIAPAVDTLLTGEEATLTVDASDADQETVADPRTVWTSTDSSVVTVTDGRVRGVRQGTATIIASAGSARASARIVVLEKVARVIVPDQTIVEHVVTAPILTVADAAGDALLDRSVDWVSSDPDVVSIDRQGRLFGNKAGSAVITATVEGVTGSGTVVVQPAALRRVYFEYMDDAVVKLGGTRPLPVRFETLSGALVERVPTWSTSDPGVVTVDATGTVRGMGVGTAEVTATVGERSGTVTVHVIRYPAPLRFNTLTLDRRRACGLTAEGLAYCWGAMNPAFLASDAPLEGVRPIGPAAPGDAGYRYSTIPLPTAEAFHFLSIAVRTYACGVSIDGTLACWGGTHPVTTLSSPHRYVEVAMSNYLVCARTEAGEVDCWAVSSSGVVGEATPVPGDHRFTRLSPSGDQYLGQQMVSEMCGVTDTQEAYCWKAPGEAPTRVGGESHFVSITSSEGVRCGIAPDGKGYCWGPNDHGQLGNGSTTASAIPVEISGGYRFSDLATAGSFTCGIIVGGSAYCWGYSEHGELGDPTSQGRSMTTPQPVSGGLKFDHIYTRLSAVCAITTDRITYCWGRNSDGELGQAERGDFFSPVPVRGQ